MVSNLRFGIGCALAFTVYVILVVWRLESFSFFIQLLLRSLVSILFFLGGIGTGFVMLAKRKFRGAIISFIFCLVPLAAFMTSGGLFDKKIDETFLQADLIITALNEHYADTGYYPLSLDKLVPRYIPSVPLTAMGIVSKHYFFYEKESLKFRLSFEANDGIYCKLKPNNDWLCDD